MSTLHHESIYETCFDESFDEYMKANPHFEGMEMSDIICIRPTVLDIIEDMAWRKFEAMCQ